MPTYLPPRRGVSQSYAMAEALQYGTSDAVLLTLALYHPSFVDDFGNQVAVYAVNDYRDLLATVEDDAPLDAGQEVRFVAVPMRVVMPEESDENRLPEVTIEVGNATRELTPYLRAAAQSMDLVTVIARTYLASDTSAPHELPPLRLSLRGATANGQAVQARAGYGDLVNVPFPRVLYTPEEFPGLPL